jgi:hypothetical protein
MAPAKEVRHVVSGRRPEKKKEKKDQEIFLT